MQLPLLASEWLIFSLSLSIFFSLFITDTQTYMCVQEGILIFEYLENHLHSLDFTC